MTPSSWPPVRPGACICGGDLHHATYQVAEVREALALRPTDARYMERWLPLTVHEYACRGGRPQRPDGCGRLARMIFDRAGDPLNPRSPWHQALFP